MQKFVGVVEMISLNQSLNDCAPNNNHSFELLLKKFHFILAHTDIDLRYTWVFNSIPDIEIPSNKHLGLRDDEIGSSDGFIHLMDLKKHVLESGKGEAEEIWFNYGEQTRIFKIQVEPMKNNEGDIIGVMTAGLEITEYKEVQSELIHNNKLTAIGGLAAGIIHEFKNILANIMGNIQVIVLKNKNLNFDKELTSRLEVIKEQSIKANEMISSVLAISRYEKPNKHKVDIRKIIANIIRLQEIHLELESIEVTKDYSDVPEVYVDPNQLEEVFLNIIINARYAMKDNESGRIDISVKEEKCFLLIKFRDNGCGIDEKIQNNIFKAYFTTKSSDNNDGVEGTGLGLSLTKKIIENHNGSISVESSKGKGTVFIIKLPIQPF